MKPLKMGIIGAGRIGKIHAENLMTRVKGTKLEAITDPFLDEDWALSKGIPITGKDHRIILDNSEINAVLICSPSSEHAQQIKECAQVGKHIFCEKPIALDPELIQNSLSDVEIAEVKLQVGFNRRFDPSFAKVQEKVSSGEIGNLHVIRVISRDPAPPPIEYVSSSGGLFMDMTIHDFDMVRFLSGSEVKEVHAYGAALVDPQIGRNGDIDTAVISLKFSNGALGIIENSRKAVYGYDQRVEVFGSKGAAIVDNDRSSSTIILNDSGTMQDNPLYFFLERYQTAYILELQAFVDAVLEDRPTPVSGKDGLAPVLIALAAQESLNSRKPVKVESI